MRLIDGHFFVQVFVTLLVIMDPIGNAPIFLGLAESREAKAKRRLAWQAVVVAGGVIGAFALFGQQILSALGITIPAIEGSGGFLLLLVALALLTGRDQVPESRDDVNVALVPLATPLIVGPGAIAATIVFVRQAHGFHDASAIALALVAVLVLVWLALRFSLKPDPRAQAERHPPADSCLRPAAVGDRGTAHRRVGPRIREGLTGIRRRSAPSYA